MIHEVFMPALSSTMTEGKIVSWSKSPGDRVEKGETILVVESDKADMDVEAFYEGYLATIIVPADESAPVGEAIALIAETEAEIEAAKQQALKLGGAKTASTPATPAPATSPTPTQPTSTPSKPPSGRMIVSPRARKLAQSLKVDLGTVNGSGPHGRIVAADVEVAAGVASPAPSAPAPSPAVAPIAAPAAAPTPRVTTTAPVPLGQVAPFNTLQQAVVRNMVESLQVPVFRVSYTITTDALDALYQKIKSKGVTMTALLAKAIAMTLQSHPLLNSSYTDQGTQYKSDINIAVAVAMDDGGLITPVLQKADQMDIYSLSRTWKDLVARSRSKQLKPDEYSTGTFTLSNLGMFGVDSFDAILPPGQGSILAIGGAKPQLVAMDNGLMGIKKQMQVNITCDHRVIYGAHAAAFLKDLATLIETKVESLTL
ncbi:MAG: dihydrolipoamide acetyltransferase family protein [Leptolyngbyaceae bacterium]|nr:dihydrolipoamide acetyltransferase family protein [Leptolyngbyaceae bacterium]